MRRLAVVVIQCTLFFGVTGACSGDDDSFSPRRIQPASGGKGGATGGRGGSTSRGGSGGGGESSGGAEGAGAPAGGFAGAATSGGSGGEPGEAGGAGGSGGASASAGAGGSHQQGGMTGSGGAGGVEAGGAGGVETGGAGGVGPSCLAAGTYAVTGESVPIAFRILGQDDPTLTLCRGNTYTFAINVPGHPFFVKTAQVSGTGSQYNDGVTGNGADVGDVVFTVPLNAPDTLHYNCSVHAAMGGVLEIVN